MMTTTVEPKLSKAPTHGDMKYGKMPRPTPF